MDRSRRVIGILQARTGSTRLPGKSLAPILGRPMLEHILRRLKPAQELSQLVLATTPKAEDDALCLIAARMGIPFFRGAEHDVLDRYYQAASHYSADVVVRLTADNPIVDADFVDWTVRQFRNSTPSIDYTNTSSGKTFPLGVSVEVFTFAALQVAWHEDNNAASREHVATYIEQHPERFRIKLLQGQFDASEIRLTVDYPEDLELMRILYEELALDRTRRTIQDIVTFLRSRPDLIQINAHIEKSSSSEG